MHKTTHIQCLNKNKTPRPLYTHRDVYAAALVQLVQQTLKTQKVTRATGHNTVLSATHNAGAVLNYLQLSKHVIMSPCCYLMYICIPPCFPLNNTLYSSEQPAAINN